MNHYSAKSFKDCGVNELSSHSFLLDKHPTLNDFLVQIKNTPDLSALLETVQKDSGSGSSAFTFGGDPNSMDLS